jgi:hypothetical protein
MKKLEYVSIEIKIEDQTVLVILIHSDGTINRKGYGTEKRDTPFAIGMGNTAEIFDKLNPLISKDFMSFLNGIFDDPNKKGKIVSLEINLMIDSKATGCKFTYGADSSGPPQPIKIFVEKSIALTNTWYAKATKIAGIKKKPWWHFWK